MSNAKGSKNLAIFHNLESSPKDVRLGGGEIGHLPNCLGSASVIVLVLIACLSKDSLCNRYMAVKAANVIGRGTNWTAFACLIETLLGKAHTLKTKSRCVFLGVRYLIPLSYIAWLLITCKFW
jgi:hypothetical protein